MRGIIIIAFMLLASPVAARDFGQWEALPPLSDGVISYLAKPCEERTLLASIQEALEHA